MGRPRKAPGERRIEGNPSKRPIPVDVFVPEGAPFVPEHLSDDAQACAELIIRTCKAKGLTAPDSYALSAFATAWAWHKAATHEMNDPTFQPLLAGSTGQLVMNPWFKILSSMSDAMHKWSPKLYLSPGDRAGLAGGSEQPTKSKFEGLIAIPGGRKT